MEKEYDFIINPKAFRNGNESMAENRIRIEGTLHKLMYI